MMNIGLHMLNSENEWNEKFSEIEKMKGLV